MDAIQVKFGFLQEKGHNGVYDAIKVAVDYYVNNDAYKSCCEFRQVVLAILDDIDSILGSSSNTIQLADRLPYIKQIIPDGMLPEEVGQKMDLIRQASDMYIEQPNNPNLNPQSDVGFFLNYTQEVGQWLVDFKEKWEQRVNALKLEQEMANAQTNQEQAGEEESDGKKGLFKRIGLGVLGAAGAALAVGGVAKAVKKKNEEREYGCGNDPNYGSPFSSAQANMSNGGYNPNMGNGAFGQNMGNGGYGQNMGGFSAMGNMGGNMGNYNFSPDAPVFFVGPNGIKAAYSRNEKYNLEARMRKEGWSQLVLRGGASAPQVISALQSVLSCPPQAAQSFLNTLPVIIAIAPNSSFLGNLQRTLMQNNVDVFIV